jgi:hypothetical protein
VRGTDFVADRHFEFTTSNGCRVRVPLAKGEALRLR